MAARKPKAEPAAPLPNSARGELAIVLEGQSYLLLPTFQAAGQIEAATGKSLKELALAADDGSLRLDQAGIIVAAALRAAAAENGLHPGNIRDAGIAERIYQEKGGVLIATRTTIGPMLRGMLLGAYDASGKAKAAEMTTGTTTRTTSAPGSAA